MIDFRYHLVSIAAIFLALAVGIVLGAGPLQNSIGSTLQNEVTGLREDKAALRTQLDQANAGIAARDKFGSAVRSRTVAGTLRGVPVALVVLPGADRTLTESVTATLQQAGASVASTTTVRSTLVDGTGTASAGTSSPTTSANAADPVQRLAAALLAPAGDGGSPSDAERQATLRSLTGAGMITGATDVPAAALAVVLSAPASSGDDAARTATAKHEVALAHTIDQAGGGAVLVEADAPTTTAVSVVSTARADGSVAADLSTLDDVSTPMGQSSLAYALVQQRDGGVGQYGLGDDARDAFPPVPAAG